MLCPRCKSTIDDDINFCKYCGAKINNKDNSGITTNINGVKENLSIHLIVSIILSWIIPGLGHVFMKLYLKGVAVFLLFYGIIFLTGYYPGLYYITLNYSIIIIVYKIILSVDLYYCGKDIKEANKYPGLL